MADRDYFGRAIGEGRPIVSEPIISRINAEPVMVLAQALRSNGQTFGVLAGGMRLRSHDLLAGVSDP